MESQLLFLVGPPRSGSTLLTRMLGTHSAIHAPAEPHLITPIAHLGFYAYVDAAPYDPIITRNASQELVAGLPGGEAQYLEALRAYTDAVYRGLLEPTGKSHLLDKTPAYALVLDFLAKLYPGARYIVLTRHPFAVWSSAVESFYDGDPEVAHRHNPLLERYVPAIARFLREKPVALHHVRYEELVKAPAEELRRICDFAGLPFEEEMVEYGAREGGRAPAAAGLGDPIAVSKETRPTTRSVARWAEDLAGRPDAVDLCCQILSRLPDEDLEVWGYRRAELASQLDAIPAESAGHRRKEARGRYALQRALLVRLRRNIHQNALGRLVRRVRFACDVLLR